MEEGEPIVVAVFPVLGESTAAVEPGDGALDDPALRLQAIWIMALPNGLVLSIAC